jgi:hypothetical protein
MDNVPAAATVSNSERRFMTHSLGITRSRQTTARVSLFQRHDDPVVAMS